MLLNQILVRGERDFLDLDNQTLQLFKSKKNDYLNIRPI